MNKIIKLSLVTSSLVTTIYADSFNQMIDNATVIGAVKSLYSNIDNSKSQSIYATAIGGFLKYELASYNGLNGGVKFITAKNIDFLSGNNKKYNDALSSDKKEYTQMSELYLNYKKNQFNIRAGRQNIDTPLADSDDVRMAPNSFEAITAEYIVNENITLESGYLKSWQGSDAGLETSWSNTGKDGTYFIGFIYKSDIVSSSLWYYNINGEKSDEIANNSYYGDLIAHYNLTKQINIDTGLQYLKQSELDDSGIESSIYGIMSDINIDDITFSLAYNKSAKKSKKQSFSGFGGGTLFTNMDSMIIDTIGVNRDADAIMTAISYQFNKFNFSYAYGDFNGDADVSNQKEHIVEQDFVLSYQYENSDVKFIYTQNNDKENSNSNDGDWNNIRVSLTYSF